ncbi:hypothetical protein [Pseudanabaena sp. BC1403]|uniref:hypothetical protein n=1 Tax=Pseudanabaena sp. BC1403 TaxID=2043171 RepID=UPI000CD955D0|nr:hypothetical protein [Pseudanabaena sp. BC1403]
MSRLVFVPLEAPYADHKYGFRTTLEESKGTILGHQTLDASTPVTGLIFKANHPKPKRASKTFATGTNSSFIAPAAIAAAIAAGWDIVKAKSNGRKSRSTFQIPVYVTVNGVKYAWGMKKSQKAKLGANFATLGIKEVTGTEQDLVFGASFPKPPRVQSLTLSGKGASATSVSSNTFYDPSNTIPDTFRTYAGLITAADWATVV